MKKIIKINKIIYKTQIYICFGLCALSTMAVIAGNYQHIIWVAILLPLGLMIQKELDDCD